MHRTKVNLINSNFLKLAYESSFSSVRKIQWKFNMPTNVVSDWTHNKQSHTNWFVVIPLLSFSWPVNSWNLKRKPVWNRCFEFGAEMNAKTGVSEMNNLFGVEMPILRISKVNMHDLSYVAERWTWDRPDFNAFQVYFTEIPDHWTLPKNASCVHGIDTGWAQISPKHRFLMYHEQIQRSVRNMEKEMVYLWYTARLTAYYMKKKHKQEG